MPTWLGQLISGGLVGGFFLTVLRFSLASMVKRLESIETSISLARNDIQEMKLERAKAMGELKAESQLMWRDIKTDKQKIVKMQSSLDKIWEVITKIASVKRPSDKIIKGE